jgi:putative lipoic acid-binding regulatory protein
MTDKKLLSFPCEFPIKVFGVATDQFEINIIRIIQQHVPDLHETAIQKRPSKDGKYLALTITVFVKSQKELDDIYCDLTASPYVLMAL